MTEFYLKLERILCFESRQPVDFLLDDQKVSFLLFKKNYTQGLYSTFCNYIKIGNGVIKGLDSG